MSYLLQIKIMACSLRKIEDAVYYENADTYEVQLLKDGLRYLIPKCTGICISENAVIEMDNETMVKIIAKAGAIETVPSAIQALNQTNDEIHENNDIEMKDKPTNKKKWFIGSIKMLINSYKENKELFRKNNVKADQVWEKIGAQMKENGYCFTTDQIKSKFTKLKQQYLKTKDHNNSTGNDPMDFAFMDEMDEIFAKDHDVQPIALASNTNVLPLAVKPLISKEKKLSGSRAILDRLDKMQESRIQRAEEMKEQRKKDIDQILETLRESNRLYDSYMQKLLDKL